MTRTWALLFAAAIMYIPANVYPIMTTTSLGHTAPSTIIGGVVQLLQMGSWPVAAVIFIASVIVPVGKLVALVWLCLWRVARNIFKFTTKRLLSLVVLRHVIDGGTND